MIRTYAAPVLAGAFALGLATAAFAATGEFSNMCAQGLANHKNVQTDCSVNADYKGKTLCFGNEQAKTDFMKDPDANYAKAQEFYKNEHKG
jgi:YHS domain-containing protein